MTIRNRLKNANRVLFNDDEYFNLDVTGVKSLADIRERVRIGTGRLVKVIECGNRLEYHLSGSDYNFSLTII